MEVGGEAVGYLHAEKGALSLPLSKYLLSTQCAPFAGLGRALETQQGSYKPSEVCVTLVGCIPPLPHALNFWFRLGLLPPVAVLSGLLHQLR